MYVDMAKNTTTLRFGEEDLSKFIVGKKNQSVALTPLLPQKSLSIVIQKFQIDQKTISLDFTAILDINYKNIKIS
jgi:hypothetical protein